MQTNESEGPAWNKFWLSMDHESDSMVSGGSHSQNPRRSILSPGPRDRGDSVLPNESASHHGGEDAHSEILDARHVANDDTPFAFKFKAPSGRVHRLQVIPSAGVAELVASVTSKLGSEVDAVGGEASAENGKLSNSGYALSYLDSEGDTVSITTDQDLVDAVVQARKIGQEKVDLFVHDPEKPPLLVQDPQPAISKTPTPTPPEPVLEKEPESTAESTPQKSLAHTLTQPSTEQLIAGVPNELILPGAIVTLAAVILGVFVLSRAGKR